MDQILASADFAYTISAMNTKQNITYVDARGLNCPVPLMLLKQAIDQLSVGDCVEIKVTDQHAELDFEIWCERFEHSLEKLDNNNGIIRFLVFKRGLIKKL